MTLSTGKDTWLTTDVHIRLQENLRRTLTKVSKELHETGPSSGGLTISDGAGVGGSDIITFSMPIVCESGGSIIDGNGDVANWGAPLTWGCTDSTCMDADNDCGTVDYDVVRYLLDANGQLLRRVLNTSGGIVREDIFAEDLTDLQAITRVAEDTNLNGVLDAGEDENSNTLLDGGITVIILTATAQRNADNARQVTATNSVNIYLRNRG